MNKIILEKRTKHQHRDAANQGYVLVLHLTFYHSAINCPSEFETQMFQWINSGGKELHTKGAGMLGILLRGLNFRFWCYLGYSGQSTIIFRREGLVEGCA